MGKRSSKKIVQPHTKYTHFEDGARQPRTFLGRSQAASDILWLSSIAGQWGRGYQSFGAKFEFVVASRHLYHDVINVGVLARNVAAQ